jgi:hypothetical protein
MPIIHAAIEGLTIECAAFVDCVRQFADALIDFGSAVSPHAAVEAAEADISPPSLDICGDGEPFPMHQLLTWMMLRQLHRLFDTATRYASEVGGPGEDAKRSELGALAVLGGMTTGYASRLLTTWNSARAGRSNAEIAGQLGIPVDRVPQMIDAAKAYVDRWSTAPPADPS